MLQEARKIRQSEKIMEHLGCPAVADVFSMSRSVSNEAHRYEEFIRFRELENGILFSEITPKAQILTCVADHFEDRFPLENWIIYDKTHKVCLVHGVRKRWVFVEAVFSFGFDHREGESQMSAGAPSFSI